MLATVGNLVIGLGITISAGTGLVGVETGEVLAEDGNEEEETPGETTAGLTEKLAPATVVKMLAPLPSEDVIAESPILILAWPAALTVKVILKI